MITGAFLLIALFLGADIYGDLSHGGDLAHVLLESGALLICAAVLAFHLASYLRRQREHVLAARAQVRDLIAERDAWRARSRHFLSGLAEAIDEQCRRWGLSPSERDVAVLMLKGLAHKEIAELRQTSERTVRQQAASVYAKAGLANRSQLLAFFLEDLALPPDPAAGA